MASRKWLFRSLILVFLAALGSGGLLVYTWMRPAFIREQVILQLGAKLNEVDIDIGSARLRLLGGITVTDLKLIRRDDPTRTPWLQVPSALLHHDKEQLNNGRLLIRKIELFKPRFRLERKSDGTWNLADVLKPLREDEIAPIFVLHDAVIGFYDRSFGEQPLAECRGIEATVINDPAPVFTIQANGNGKPSGAFSFDAKIDRKNQLSGVLDMPKVLINADLARLVEAFESDAAEMLRPLIGQASVHLDFARVPGVKPQLFHDLKIQLQNSRYTPENLPFPFQQINANIRFKNGDLTIEQGQAHVGDGTMTLTLDLPRDPPNVQPVTLAKLPSAADSLAPERSILEELEERIRLLQVTWTNMKVTPDLFMMMPGKASVIGDMFQPNGSLSGSFTFQRREGHWSRAIVVEPLGMAATYRGFPYPLQNVRGRITNSLTDSTIETIKMDLQAEGGGAAVRLNGTISGTAPDKDVNLVITGKGVTLDETLIKAMPDDNPEILRRLHATAAGDFVALIRQNDATRRQYGADAFDNEFTIAIRQGSMKYDVFPYPLENMTGKLVVRTLPERPANLPGGASPPPAKDSGELTSLEFIDFQASKNGSFLRASGRKDPAPGGSILTLNIDGESLALDSDLQRALAAIRMENSWKSFEPSGRVNCALSVRLFTKTDPKAEIYPPEDLELAMAFAGGTIKPNFFPYELNELTGRFSYAKGRAELRDFKARHGGSEITLPSSEILFRPSGGYWADIRDLNVNPFIIDAAFREALPPGLKNACEGLELKGKLALHASRVVVDEQPGPFMPRALPNVAQAVPEPIVQASALIPTTKPILPTIYWDGRITMSGASMKTGVDWDKIEGTFASWGVYKGDRLGAVRGNIVFDKATVAKQPVEAMSASLRVDPRQPNVLTVPSIRAKFYGGDIGGEAWVVLDDQVRYALQLNAARVHLSELAKHFKLPPKAHLEGLGSAQIYLANRLDERTGQPLLQGGGSIDIPSGKLLNLPVLLNLIKVVKLRVPDETGFEEAHALFFIRGDRIRFGQLDLIGNAISLGGEGEMKIDGSEARFEFYPVWTKMKEMFALPGDWSGAISKRFLKIKVSGDLDGKMDYRAEPVPGIVEPVKRVVNRLKPS